MSSPLSGASLVRRAAAEHRRAVLALAILLAINSVVYAAVVHPLARRVANIEQRDQAAERALAAARADHARASGTLTGKARAATELDAFYTSVLPPGLGGARRMTLVRFEQLARQNGLDLVGPRVYESEPLRNSTLTRLAMRLAVAGAYPDIRRFIHQLEAGPEFIVIDNIELAETAEDPEAVELSLELSTYYRTGS